MITHYDYKTSKFLYLTIEESIKKSHYELMAERKSFGWIDVPLCQQFDKEDMITPEAKQMLSNLKYKKVNNGQKTITYVCSSWYVDPATLPVV